MMKRPDHVSSIISSDSKRAKLLQQHTHKSHQQYQQQNQHQQQQQNFQPQPQEHPQQLQHQHHQQQQQNLRPQLQQHHHHQQHQQQHHQQLRHQQQLQHRHHHHQQQLHHHHHQQHKHKQYLQQHHPAASQTPTLVLSSSRFDAEFGAQFDSDDLERLLSLTDAVNGTMTTKDTSSANTENHDAQTHSPTTSTTIAVSHPSATMISGNASFDTQSYGSVTQRLSDKSSHHHPHHHPHHHHRAVNSATARGESLLKDAEEQGISVDLLERDQNASLVCRADQQSEMQKLKIRFTQCSKERSELRLEQRRIRNQLAEKSGAASLLRSKLHSLETRLRTIESETSRRVNIEAQAHRVQHDRLKKQIETVNAERDAQEAELEALGTSNKALQIALSKEKQEMLRLRRLHSSSHTQDRVPQHNISAGSTSQPQPALASQKPHLHAKKSVQTPSSLPKRSMQSQTDFDTTPTQCLRAIPPQHPQDASVISRILSSSLEDGLFDLVRSLGHTKTEEDDDDDDEDIEHSFDTESTLSLLLSESLPMSCALPIIQRLVAAHKQEPVIPALKLLHTLISSSDDCREAVLGAPTASSDDCRLNNDNAPQHSSTALSSDYAPNPFWIRPGSGIVLSSGVAQAASHLHGRSMCESKNFPHISSSHTHTKIVKCPAMLPTLFHALESSLTGVVIESLRILTALIAKSSPSQLVQFEPLVTSSALSRVLHARTELPCRYAATLMLAQLLRWPRALQCLSYSYENTKLIALVYSSLTWQAEQHATHEDVFRLRLASIDMLSFLVGRYGSAGVTCLDQTNEEFGIQARIAMMLTDEMDLHVDNHYNTDRFHLVVKGFILLDVLFQYLDVRRHIQGFAFVFAGLLTRLMTLFTQRSAVVSQEQTTMQCLAERAAALRVALAAEQYSEDMYSESSESH